jgi:hypothetical protein
VFYRWRAGVGRDKSGQRGTNLPSIYKTPLVLFAALSTHFPFLFPSGPLFSQPPPTYLHEFHDLDASTRKRSARVAGNAGQNGLNGGSNGRSSSSQLCRRTFPSFSHLAPFSLSPHQLIRTGLPILHGIFMSFMISMHQLARDRLALQATLARTGSTVLLRRY